MILARSVLLGVLLAAPAHAADVSASKPAPPAPGERDWRMPDPENLLVIDTSKGRIIVEMAPAAAPQSVARIKELARRGFYDGRAFFRVVEDFMDQTGDPQDNGMGGSSLPNLAPEFDFRRSSDMLFAPVTKSGGLDVGLMGSLPVVSQSMDLGLLTADNRVGAHASFCAGVAAMARAEALDSANSQFFLMRGANPALDEKYAAWGRVIVGLDVVRAIKAGEPPPPPADVMTKVRVLADVPAAGRPQVRVIDPQGPWLAAAVERLKADKGAEFSICDIDLPTQVK